MAALTPIEDFNEAFDAGFSDDEFDTIGGILLQNFGRFPRIGDSVTIEDLVFRVVDGDNRQIRQLEVTRQD